VVQISWNYNTIQITPKKLKVMEYTDQQRRFIESANETISDNPADRLGPKAREIVDSKNFVFDAHCHIFDGACVKVTYLVARLLLSFAEFLPPRIYWIVKTIFRKIFGALRFNLKEAEFSREAFISDTLPGRNSTFDLMTDAAIQEEIDQPIEDFIAEIEASRRSEKALSVPDFLDELESEMNELDKQLEEMMVGSRAGTPEAIKLASLDFDRGFIKRVLKIIKILRFTKMESVLNGFEKNFAINHVYNKFFEADKDQLTIVLGMDLNSGWQGTSEKSNSTQNKELGELAKTEAILPYLPIDPRRADDEGDKNLYKFFLKAFNKDNPAFFGVKCYPAMGYLPTDHRLHPIFKVCAEKNIPVMTHCGGEMISTFANPVIAYRGEEKVEIDNQRRKHRTRRLNEPEEWKPVLEAHPNLRLCLGHFGGRNAWDGHKKTKHRIRTILDMMQKYDNLYADFSFNLESPQTVKRFKKKLLASDADGKVMKSRTLFGTDYWVVLPISDLNKDQKHFLEEMGDLCDKLVTDNVMEYLGLP